MTDQSQMMLHVWREWFRRCGDRRRYKTNLQREFNLYVAQHYASKARVKAMLATRTPAALAHLQQRLCALPLTDPMQSFVLHRQTNYLRMICVVKRSACDDRFVVFAGLQFLLYLIAAYV